jgi:hypothetical protein
MNLMLIPKWFRRLAALAALVLCVTFLLWSRLVWTPVQRYYLGAYFRCSWPGFDPASPVEVRWIYKTAPSELEVIIIIMAPPLYTACAQAVVPEGGQIHANGRGTFYNALQEKARKVANDLGVELMFHIVESGEHEFAEDAPCSVLGVH